MPRRIVIESKSYYLSFRSQQISGHSKSSFGTGKHPIRLRKQKCAVMHRTKLSNLLFYISYQRPRRKICQHSRCSQRRNASTIYYQISMGQYPVRMRRFEANTRPFKARYQTIQKITNIKDVKRYLSVASIAKDGLLVVRRCDPFVPSSELIIVPRSVLQGLVTALHIKLDHPSKHQLNLVLKRYLYALDMS